MGQRAREPLVFPLGLAYIASSIKKTHDVTCFDPNICENAMKELSSVLEKTNPEIVGLSLRNIDSVFSFNKRSYYPKFKLMIKQIKQQKPNCKLVVGGAGFSIFAEEIIKDNPEIDFGVVAEGENSFAQLVDNLGTPDHVPNLIFLRKGQILFTKQKMADFDLLPVPSRDLFEVKKYQKAQFSIGVQSKRGCGFNCVFCSKRVQGGNVCRARSPISVVDEIESLVNDFGINSCFFVDSTFNFPVDHCREICEEIIKRKLELRWSADFRPDYLNEAVMRLCVKAGCSWFSFSPDGACDLTMQLLGKNFGVHQLEKTFELARKTDGAQVGYSFLYDLPFHNAENTLGLLSLLPKMMYLCGTKVRYVTFSRMRIYPRTKFYQIAYNQGKIDANTNLLYPTYYKSSSLPTIENFLVHAVRDSTRLLIKVNSIFDKFRDKNNLKVKNVAAVTHV